MKWLFNAIPYLLALATIAAGAVDLIQKWEELKGKRLRKAVPALFVLVGVLTILSLHHDNSEKEKAAEKADKDIQGLNANVALATKAQQTAIQAQKDNTEVFAAKFEKLSGEVGDLKTQVRTDALQRQLRGVQVELENTQKALEPGPKPKLLFTFVPFENPPFPQHPIPVTDITLPVGVDGTVQVQFAMLNNTNVDARDVEVTVKICKLCRFVKEPAGFVKDSVVDPETERVGAFPPILSSTWGGPFVVDVLPPRVPHSGGFKIAITYRCSGCGANEPSEGTVRYPSPVR